MIKILILCLLVIFKPVNCCADEASSDVYEKLGIYDSFDVGSEIFPELNLKYIISKFENGESFDFKTVLENIFEFIIKTLTSHYNVLVTIVVTGFAVSIINTIKHESGAVSETTFNISYALYAALLIFLFTKCIEPAKELFESVVLLIKTSMPTLITLLNFSGGFTSASMINSVLIIMIEVLTQVVNLLVFPLIIASVTISVANNMSDRINIGTMVTLMRQAAKWILGFCLAIYTGFYGVYGLVGSSIDNRIGKAARYAIGRGIPVVGGVVAESIETVMSTLGAVRNITGAAGIIMISIWGLIPIIKTAVYILVFKLAAIVLEPISDRRIIALTTETSEAISLIMSVLIATCLLFIGCVGILLITGNFIN